MSYLDDVFLFFLYLLGFSISSLTSKMLRSKLMVLISMVLPLSIQYKCHTAWILLQYWKMMFQTHIWKVIFIILPSARLKWSQDQSFRTFPCTQHKTFRLTAGPNNLLIHRVYSLSNYARKKSKATPPCSGFAVFCLIWTNMTMNKFSCPAHPFIPPLC